MTLTFKRLRDAAEKSTNEHTYDVISGTLEEIESGNVKSTDIPNPVVHALKESIRPQKMDGGEVTVRSYPITMETLELLDRLSEDKHPAVHAYQIEEIARELFPYYREALDYAFPKKNKAFLPKGLQTRYNR